ncbi:MAG TPA: exosortase system-associated protein, TIGR04073 family [Candidatus Limnocylindria bacterium]|jgi:putative exosortase-associated protein (TIGR04073 family)|nr:exosortase system-associated protein, TIGR04073 family [Candidatus Limnocylindria bacterium]
MRVNPKKFVALAGVATLLAGCTAAEQKLGRGITNITEPFRLGEIQASYEEGRVLDGPTAGTVGFIHGVNRTIARTVVGAAEIVTFPIPSDPLITPVDPRHPDSYTGGLPDSTVLGTDNALGITGGESMSILPGSRFHVFD